jgi:ABC-2 type transport system permease protein
MIISFALYGAIGISMELFELKKQNILKRSFTTANKPETIIGGVLGALFIVSSIAYSGAFLLSSYIFSSSNLEKAPVIVLNIVCLVMVALSLGVFITRIVKNENLINMVLQITIALTCFIGGSFMPIEFLPKGIAMFSKFTPQYWALQSINTGNAWLSIIVLMFSVALFTCGTFKAKNFI